MNGLNANPKKPKVEEEEDDDDDDEVNDTCREEQEEALVALVEHRANEVERIKQRISNYKSQYAVKAILDAIVSGRTLKWDLKLIEAERSLQDSRAKLARLCGQDDRFSSRGSPADETKGVKEELRVKNLGNVGDVAARNPTQSKKGLAVPSENAKPRNSANPQGSLSKSDAVTKQKSRGGHDAEASGVRDRGIKRKFEQKAHKELIRLIGKNPSPTTIKCHASNQISSQHKRKLRSLILCPANEKLFATSSLDGSVNLWQLQPGRLVASLLSSTDCLSPKQRRWAEDMAWHPYGNSIVSIYAADDGDSQISILNLNKTHGSSRVTFLENKPHVKGIINNIMFMPWENTCFVTGGSDHAVVLWSETDEENKWKVKPLHRNLHSAAVMGVAGMRQKHIVLSVGADKRIYGFDVQVGRADYRHQIEYKCMSVLPNPCDFNLFMVQSGQPEKQLRLFDIRLRQTEIHSFGWKQDSSESQSALINQSWSPDGLSITSGSADPVIHIFDIRYSARKPSQSIKAHQKRVFKAEWHYSQPLLISISSDLNVGLHKIS